MPKAHRFLLSNPRGNFRLPIPFFFLPLLVISLSSPANAGTFQVTTTGDSGAGSLRAGITSSNASPGANTITFNIPGGGTMTITAVTTLPSITNSVTIDATSQPGYSGTPLILVETLPSTPVFSVTGGNASFLGLGVIGTAGANTVGGAGGAGFTGIFISGTGSFSDSQSVINGGTGGDATGAANSTISATAGSGGIGGTGGIGLLLNGSSSTNSGQITGGTGGGAVGGISNAVASVGGQGGSGGAGGSAVSITANGITFDNTSTISGGAGGAGDGGAGNFAVAQGGSAGNGGIGGDGIDSIGNSIVLTNSSSVSGGAGGSATGGSASGAGVVAGNGGTGSAGGAGYNISGIGATLTNNGVISGGAGGSANGGTTVGASSVGGNGGTGGTGGAGITISASGVTITNNNTITGGNGGTAGGGTTTGIGSSGGANGTGGSGGAAISFSAGSGIVINSGVITGGLANGGSGAQADAIDFAGSNNQLQILSTSSITGNVVVQSPGSNNALILTGSTNGTFDVSKIGVQYQGFDTELKTGTSTWTLTNTTTAVTPWNVTGGTLQISSDANLGNASGSLILNGGALATTASFATNRTITLGASGGSFAPAASTQFTVGSAITGSGALNEQGTGTLILSANNTYTGGTTISNGTLQIGVGGTTGNVVGNVTDNGSLAFNRSDSVTFGGVISGTGSLTQQGAGSLTLSGANTYSGGTALQNGTLILGNSQALGSGALTAIDPTVVYTNGIAINNSVILNGLTTLEVDNSDSATQSGVISGTSGITKVGTGSLTLSGSNTFSGGTTLSAGTLVIANPNGLGNGSVTVNGGTLMTDGVNHLINVNGNYTQTGGTLALSLYSATVFDQMAVSGKATLGGTLALNFQNGLAPGSGQSFALVKANQAIAGQFSTVTSNLPSLGATVVYSNNATLTGNTITTTSVPVLVLTQKSFGDLYGNYLSSNEHGAASYIDAQDQAIKNASFGNLVAALNQISPSENGLRSAFDELSPLKFHSFSSSTAFNNTPFLIQQFDDYLSSHRSENGEFVASSGGIDASGLVINDPTIDPGLQTVHSHLMAFNTGAGSPAADSKDLKNVMAPEPDLNRWNAFATGNVILGQDFSVSQSGLSHSDITSENVQIGADYRISPNWLAGVTFGYGHSGANVDPIGSAAYVDTYSPGLYAAYSKGNWYANSLFNYGFNNYTQHRNVQIGSFDGTALSKPTGNQIVLNSDGGYDFHQGGWTFGPTAGLDYVHLDINHYSESGLPGADLNVNKDQSDSLRSLLGGHVSYRFTGEGVTFTSHLNASWQHEFFDAGRNITSQFNDIGTGSFTARTANPSRESALIDAGLDAQITRAISLFTNYTVQAGQENYFGQSVEAGMKVSF